MISYTSIADMQNNDVHVCLEVRQKYEPVKYLAVRATAINHVIQCLLRQINKDEVYLC